LDLNREVTLEAEGGFGMVEDVFERSILECGAIDVAGDPVVVKNGLALK
jgi:hypothetical protein